MKPQIQLRERSIYDHSSSAVRYSTRDDMALPFLRNRTQWPRTLWALTEKTKIRARPGATCLSPARRRWWTSSAKCREKPQKEFGLRQSRPPAADSFPPYARHAAA